MTLVRHGMLVTNRPERYAKQLASHWSAKGSVEETDEATTIRLDSGEEVRLVPAIGQLDIEASVPGGGDPDQWARVVADHLERFGQREDMSVIWTDDPT